MLYVVLDNNGGCLIGNHKDGEVVNWMGVSGLTVKPLPELLTVVRRRTAYSFCASFTCELANLCFSARNDVIILSMDVESVSTREPLQFTLICAKFIVNLCTFAQDAKFP